MPKPESPPHAAGGTGAGWLLRSLAVSSACLASIRQHGEGAYPEECCGLLVGCSHRDSVSVHSVMAVPNRASCDRRRRFALASSDFVSARRAAVASGLDVVGFYHSHPDGAPYPSLTDLRYAWPDMVYVILSLASEGRSVLRAHVLSEDGQGFEALEVREVSYG